MIHRFMLTAVMHAFVRMGVILLDPRAVRVWRRVECREGEHEVEPIFARFLLSRSFPFTQRPPFSPRSLVPRRVRRTARHVQAVPGRGRLQPGSR